jgi:hypothetical protein
VDRGSGPPKYGGTFVTAHQVQCEINGGPREIERSIRFRRSEIKMFFGDRIEMCLHISEGRINLALYLMRCNKEEEGIMMALHAVS